MTSRPVEAVVTGIFGAYYQVLPLQGSELLLAKARGNLRVKHTIQARDRLLAVGDRVNIEMIDSHDDEFEAYIDSILERKNSFQRASYGKLQTIAANIDRVVVISSFINPAFSPGFLDRVLCEAELADIRAFIVLNKTDLAEKEGGVLNKVKEYSEEYSRLGYPVFYESFLGGISEPLQQEIARGYTLLLGQSGVGKSTFLNQMLGEDRQKTQQLTSAEKGRHTTTNPVAFKVKKEVMLIDVPGVKEFGLQHYNSADICHGFREFQGCQCRFDNCLHDHEPGCEVKNRLGKEISKQRYQSYLSILNSLDEKYKQRKGNFWRDSK